MSRELPRSVCRSPSSPKGPLTELQQSTIGNVTGSEAWKQSGEQNKAAGTEAMKQASEHRDSTQGYGKVEELAGKAVGCEGMEKEGSLSKQ